MLGWLHWRSMSDESRRQTWTGVVSGALSAGLAMPGPAVAAHLGRSGRSKDAVRSVTISLFLWSYPMAYTAQAFVVGPSAAALDLAWHLLPASLLGVPAGVWLAGRLSETIFRRLGLTVMIATAVALVATA